MFLATSHVQQPTRTNSWMETLLLWGISWESIKEKAKALKDKVAEKAKALKDKVKDKFSGSQSLKTSWEAYDEYQKCFRQCQV